MELLKFINNLNTLPKNPTLTTTNRNGTVYLNGVQLGTVQNFDIQNTRIVEDDTTRPEWANNSDMATMTARFITPTVPDGFSEQITDIVRTVIREEFSQFVGRINNVNTRNEIANAIREVTEPYIGRNNNTVVDSRSVEYFSAPITMPAEVSLPERIEEPPQNNRLQDLFGRLFL